MTIETHDTPSDVSPDLGVENVTPDIDTNSDIPTDAATEPVFTPNYKYKAYGKEFEMDEWARPLVNESNHAELTKLFERAGGFDQLKEHSKKIEQEYNSTRANYQQLASVKNTLLQNLDRGDLDSVFNYLGLKEDAIFDYARTKLEYQALPPEQRQAHDHYHQLNRQVIESQNQVQQNRLALEEITRQKHELETMQVYSNPKYSSVINSFNGSRGNEKAFDEVVRMIGSNEFYATGRNLPVAEVVERAINFLGLSNQEQANYVNSQQAPGNNIPNKPAPKPITMIGKGGSQVPVKKNIATMADLLKAQAEAFGE